MVRSPRDEPQKDEEKGGGAPMKKKWNRAPRDKPECKEPRRAGFRTGVAFDMNNIKKTQTLKKYRTGYNTAWGVPAAREHMVKCGFREPGTYDPNNQQGGAMFSLPRELPTKRQFSDEDAGIILRRVFKSGATLSQCEAVRKMLSFAYQLRMGLDGNWEACGIQWRSQDPGKYGEPTQSVLAKIIIEPSGLTTCFTTEWSPANGMAYLQWNVGLLVVHDWCVLGARSKSDLDKIKKSVDHVVVESEGWMCTRMVGGRAKLEARKGIRPWYAYRVCFCPDGKHKGLPAGWRAVIGSNHAPSWCTTCPLTAFQVIRESLPQDDNRTYPNIKKDGTFAKTNAGKETIIPLGRKWINAQGGNPDDLRFDGNSGRKALGKWCDEFNVPYSWSFEIHGDLWCTWSKFYQNGLRKEPAFARRTQSREPVDCCRALRKFARAIGRGRTVREDPKEFSLNQVGQLLSLQLRRQGLGTEVNKILDA